MHADAADRDGRWVVPLSFAAAAALAAAFHLHAGFVNDDALITVRYAEHLARGEGLVYNPGERVLGTTTPLWALLLAGAAAVGLDAATVASWLGVVAHGAAAALTAVLFRRRGAGVPVQCLAAVLAGGLPLQLTWAGSGMETALYVAWIAAFLVLFEARAWVALGFVGGAAVLTRPDAGLLLAAAAVVETVRSRSLHALVRALPGFLVVVLPWAIGAGLWYGSPLPNSGFAKRLQVEDWGTYRAMLGGALWDAGPLLPFALVGGVAAVVAPARILPAAGLVAIAVGMHLGGMPGCAWYAPPALYLVVVLAAHGAGAAADASVAAHPWVRRALLASPLLALAVLPRVAHEDKVAQRNLEQCHGRVGSWLAEHAPRDASVAVDNIGYIGHRSGLRVVDMLGLIQPETAAAIARGERDHAIRAHRPELIAVWARRGSTWKYMPPAAWLEEQGYRVAFEAPLFPQYPQGAAYVVWSRVPLRTP